MLDYILIGIITTLIFLAVVVVKQLSSNKKLKAEFIRFNCKTLIITDDPDKIETINRSAGTKVIDSNSNNFTQNAFVVKVMKKTGVQKLPAEIWLSEQGELKGKHVKH